MYRRKVTHFLKYYILFDIQSTLRAHSRTQELNASATGNLRLATDAKDERK